MARTEPDSALSAATEVAGGALERAVAAETRGSPDGDDVMRQMRQVRGAGGGNDSDDVTQ